MAMAPTREAALLKRINMTLTRASDPNPSVLAARDLCPVPLPAWASLPPVFPWAVLDPGPASVLSQTGTRRPSMDTQVPFTDPHAEIREEVRNLCSHFPGEYWRKLDRERAYP